MVFGDVIGQSHITTTLRNAISSNRLHHAYVFSGPRGVGKTTTARILAKAINCLHPVDNEPDNTCELCTEITEGRSVHVFEIDGASNRSIDDIRSLREAVRYAPSKGHYKVYIIDEVHMLTKEAFNALLKTLEEPPPYIVFVFATTEIHKVPLTILSRCQRFDFRRVTVEEIITRLEFIASKEGISIDREALFVLAHKADGSMRDAQSLFDQVVSFCGTTITVQQIMEALNIVDQEMFFRVTNLITSKDAPGMLALVEDIINKGYDFKEFIGGLIEHFRNLLIARSTGSVQCIEASDAYRGRYLQAAPSFSELDILRFIKLTGETENAIKWSQQPRYRVEIAFLQMQKMESSLQIDQLMQQLDALKLNVSNSALMDNPRSEQNLFEGSNHPTAKTGGPAPGRVKPVTPAQKLPTKTAEPKPVYYKQPDPYTASEPPVLPQQEKPYAPISMDEALSKWMLFVNGVRKQKIHVGTMLSESKLDDVHENRFKILCPDDFHLETFKRNREFLYTLAEQVYGAKVRLEAIVTKEGVPSIPTSERAGSEDPSPQPSSQQREVILNHPMTQMIMKEFGCDILDQ